MANTFSDIVFEGNSFSQSEDIATKRKLKNINLGHVTDL